MEIYNASSGVVIHRLDADPSDSPLPCRAQPSPVVNYSPSSALCTTCLGPVELNTKNSGLDRPVDIYDLTSYNRPRTIKIVVHAPPSDDYGHWVVNALKGIPEYRAFAPCVSDSMSRR